jgi:hypothetical protein
MHYIYKKPYLIFILCNVLSISMMFANVRAGAMLSMLMLAGLVLNFDSVLKPLIRPEHRLFQIFLALEILSFVHYVTNSEAVSFVSNHPRIILEVISYILIPQLFFYWIGVELSISSLNINLQFRNIIIVNLGLIILCIILHLWVPDFYINFATQYFETTSSGQSSDKEIIPRMHGYMNSMELGMICSSNIVFAGVLIKNKFYKIGIILVFLLGSILTLQRGSWVACLLAILLLSGISLLKNKLDFVDFFRKNLLEIGVAVAIVLIGFLVFASLSEDSEGYAPHLLSRIAEFADAANERSQQVVDAKIVLEKYPFGIGLGLLTLRGTDYGFRYSVTDTIYYRMFAELGYIGGLVFVAFLIGGLIKLYKKRLFYLVAVLLIYMFQATGSAVFELYYCSFPFWMFMAIAYNKKEVGVA